MRCCDKEVRFAWLVVAASALIMFVGPSTYTCYGLLFSDVKLGDTINKWVLTIMYFCWNFSAIIVGPLTYICTHRKITMIGCFVAACGFLLTEITLDSPALFFSTFGFMVGTGLGMANNATFLLIASHFNSKYRGFAISVTLLNSALGHLLSPLFYKGYETTIDRLHIKSLMTALSFLSATFYITPELMKDEEEEEDKLWAKPKIKKAKIPSILIHNETDIGNLNLNNKRGQVEGDEEDEDEELTNLKLIQLPNYVPPKKMARGERKPLTRSVSDKILPNIPEESDLSSSTSNSTSTPSQNSNESNSSSPTKSYLEVPKGQQNFNTKIDQVDFPTKWKRPSAYEIPSKNFKLIGLKDRSLMKRDELEKIISPLRIEPISGKWENNKQKNNNVNNNIKREKTILVNGNDVNTNSIRKNSSAGNSTNNKPASKINQLKLGEHKKVPKPIVKQIESTNKSNNQQAIVNMSTESEPFLPETSPRVVSVGGVAEFDSREKTSCNMTTFFGRINFSLLKDWRFINMAIGVSIVQITFPAYPFILHSYIKLINHHGNTTDTDYEAAFTAQTIISIIQIISRPIFGYISDHPKINRRLAFLIATFSSAIIISVSSFVENTQLIYAFCVLYGINYAIQRVSETLMFVDIFGMPNLPSTYGLVSLIKGIIVLLTTTIMPSPVAFYNSNIHPLGPKDNTTSPLAMACENNCSNSEQLENGFEMELQTKRNLFYLMAIPGFICTVCWMIELLCLKLIVNRSKINSPQNQISPFGIGVPSCPTFI